MALAAFLLGGSVFSWFFPPLLAPDGWLVLWSWVIGGWLSYWPVVTDFALGFLCWMEPVNVSHKLTSESMKVNFRTGDHTSWSSSLCVWTTMSRIPEAEGLPKVPCRGGGRHHLLWVSLPLFQFPSYHRVVATPTQNMCCVCVCVLCEHFLHFCCMWLYTKLARELCSK